MALADSSSTAFFRAYAHAILERQHKHLAVPYRTRLPALHDGFDGGLDEIVIHGNKNLDLAEQVAHLLDPPIDLGNTHLPSVPQDLGHGDKVHLCLVKLLLDRIQPVRFDNGNDHLHILRSSYSKRVYAFSLCWVRSRPMISSFSATLIPTIQSTIL